MSASHLLYLDAELLSAYTWQRGQLALERAFPINSEELRDFGEYLLMHRQARFRLLVNLADEGYVTENIPRLWGSDRRALIARKAKQHFPEPALNCVFSLGMEKTTRKTENLLIAALMGTEQLQPCLQTLANCEAALAGVYSTAQLNGALLKKLGYTPPSCLLLSLFKTSMRESYLADGQTVFSRLIPITDRSPAAIAYSFATEAGKLQQYLIGQRRIGRDEALPIFVIAHPESVDEIAQACAVTTNQAITLIDNQAAAHRLKLKTPAPDNCSELLFLHQLTSNTPRQQFATQELRRSFRLAQTRRLIWAMSAGILATGTLSAANDIQQARLLTEETRQQRSDESILRHHHQEIVAAFPALDISHESLRQITDRHAELVLQQNRMPPTLALLANALDQVSAIELESLDWKAGTTGTKEMLAIKGYVQEEATSGTTAKATLERFMELLREIPNCRIDTPHPLLPSSAAQPFADDDASSPRSTQEFLLRMTFQK